MKNRRISKRTVQQAALRAFLYNIVLMAALWILLLFVISKHHWTAILPYELLLHLIILLMLSIYGITFVVFLMGLFLGFIRKGNPES